MNTRNRNLIGLMALALLITMAPISQAQAGIVVRAGIDTPHLSVRVNTVGGPSVRYSHLRPLAPRPHVIVHIDRQDRQMARRLSRYTGESQAWLLKMRRYGYSWREIGDWMGLSPRVVRAARNAESWERFLHGGRQVKVVRCGTHAHR